MISIWQTLLRIRCSADLTGAPAQRSPLNSFGRQRLPQAAPPPLSINAFPSHLAATPSKRRATLVLGKHLSGQERGLFYTETPCARRHKPQRCEGVRRRGAPPPPPRLSHCRTAHPSQREGRAQRPSTAARGARPGMSPTSLQLFLKQRVCRSLQPSAKPPEQSFSLALPWINLGMLLGSSLALMLAGSACTSLKGKAGSEQSCGCRTQPNTASPSFHPTEPKRLTKGRRGASSQDEGV